MSLEAYPLSWPMGWPRTPAHLRRRAKFAKKNTQYRETSPGHTYAHTTTAEISIHDGTTRVLRELERIGAAREDIVISSNLRLRVDGLPMSGQREPEDPGVSVYWLDTTMRNTPRCMAVDLYDRTADNLAAVAATIEAMRAIERHGGARIMERAFQGFTALPAPGKTSIGWRGVLRAPEQCTLEEVERLYKVARSANHPDRGGHPEQFNQVELAWKEAQDEFRRV